MAVWNSRPESLKRDSVFTLDIWLVMFTTDFYNVSLFYFHPIDRLFMVNYADIIFCILH